MALTWLSVNNLDGERRARASTSDLSEQKHLFGSSLHGSWFESPRAITDAALYDADTQLRQFDSAAG